MSKVCNSKQTTVVAKTMGQVLAFSKNEVFLWLTKVAPQYHPLNL